MSDDGADMGVGAEAGMRAALGSDEPVVERTPEEFRAYIEAHQGGGYEGCANRAALAILQLFETVPGSSTWPGETETEFYLRSTGEVIPTAEGWRRYNEPDVDHRKVGPDLYASVKEGRSDLYDDVWSQLTGFQWGWAVNAAKYMVGEPPIPNPAIVEVGTR